MSFQYNSNSLKTNRKSLREKQTDAEKILWNKLRNKQIKQLRFVRQYSVGPYIVDFYCPSARLAIELDGGQHLEDENKIYDQERTAYLNLQEIKVLRFWNHHVMKNLEGVLQRIFLALP